MKCLLPALLLCVGAPVYAQQRVAAATPPANPNQFMRTAADAMSLTAADMKPWHLKANYQQLNQDGSIRSAGVLEAWWGGPDRFKISYNRSDFTQTLYRTGQGTFLTGDEQWPPNPEYVVSSLLLHPMPGQPELDKLTITSKDVTIGATQLHCFPAEDNRTKPKELAQSRVYCFANSLPILRVLQEAYWRTSFNGIVRVNGHYLARQIRRMDANGIPFISIDVDKYELLPAVDEAMFAPPPEAKPEPQRKLDFAEELEGGQPISASLAIYPDAAKALRIEGKVVLKGTVGTDGTVKNLTIVSGPVMFQQAAIDSVKTWRFAPYLLAGEPVEVAIEMNLEFKNRN